MPIGANSAAITSGGPVDTGRRPLFSETDFQTSMSSPMIALQFTLEIRIMLEVEEWHTMALQSVPLNIISA